MLVFNNLFERVHVRIEYELHIAWNPFENWLEVFIDNVLCDQLVIQSFGPQNLYFFTADAPVHHLSEFKVDWLLVYEKVGVPIDVARFEILVNPAWLHFHFGCKVQISNLQYLVLWVVPQYPECCLDLLVRSFVVHIDKGEAIKVGVIAFQYFSQVSNRPNELVALNLQKLLF